MLGLVQLCAPVAAVRALHRQFSELRAGLAASQAQEDAVSSTHAQADVDAIRAKIAAKRAVLQVGRHSPTFARTRALCARQTVVTH